MDNKYNFTFKKEDGEEVECELLLSFYVKEKDKNYMLFTDNTYDESNNMNVYVYYNTSESDDLIPVTDDKEFNMIDSVYKQVVKKVCE